MRVLQDELLPEVVKPQRYIGNEWGSVRKDPSRCEVSFLLAFPDIYDIGMSHLGFKILYYILNQREDVCAERTYAPWHDMENAMRQRGMPLFSLESHRPAREFDFIGFTLQYELSYPAILNMLDLAGIPVMAASRRDGDPFIIAGGPGAYNPEPLWAFIDFFVIGEGEEVIGEIVDLYRELKKAGAPRSSILGRMSRIEGIYVPSFYEPVYGPGGELEEVRPLASEAPRVVRKRVVKDLDRAVFPDSFVVPFMEVVHDRAMLEVFRGCTRGCRFCQAGMVYRPVRERSPERVKELASRILKNTGYDELSLSALSILDYSCAAQVLHDLVSRYGPEGITVSLPSLRVDTFSVDLAKEVEKTRKTGLTFAPEAGTQRLRNVINKGVREEDLMEAVRAAFNGGWDTIKLYFMIGLPTETTEDILGIARLARAVRDAGVEIAGSKTGALTRFPRVNVSVASFVPKAHTPFQWCGQAPMEELLEKQRLLKESTKVKGLTLSWHDAGMSLVEAAIARGDRRVARAMRRAWELGSRLDSWSEGFDLVRWQRAFEESGLSLESYATRDIPLDQVLPWDHISTGVSKEYLRAEFERAMRGEVTPDCRFERCSGCDVCFALRTSPKLYGKGVR
ncbi:MAG TPA: TIGR03960 family B12-binding radical SAM protein [Firmicutes bacterium]|nr:TIGR03960 family B12-binding radical SAM protein [Bacillota bacterium]